jgi:metal-responsive CopG/Arc/MetJ family transcriptional regulator
MANTALAEAAHMDNGDDEQLTERIIIPVTKTMEAEIKEFWHERRLNSKSEAVRHLIAAGLSAERKRGKK